MEPQPDLLGETEAREARATRERMPAICPCCGTCEPNAWLLRLNHGIELGDQAVSGYPAGQHPIYGGQCIAQNLVANHIYYAVKVGSVERLERDARRGRELGLDVEAIIRRAEVVEDVAAVATPMQEEDVKRVQKSRDEGFPAQRPQTSRQQDDLGESAVQAGVERPRRALSLAAESVADPVQDLLF